MIRRWFTALSVFALTTAPTLLAQAPGQTPESQSGFVPISELPPSQQLPAAPFLIAAYAFIWVALMAYLWSIWRRLGRVEQEMRALDQRSNRSGGR
jgi:CcmD family protein